MGTESKRAILEHQRKWAVTEGLRVDAAGYVESIEANLRAPLSNEARIAFSRGSGGELKASRRRPPKMCALHSSAALAANVFDFWSGRDRSLLSTSLGLQHRIVAVNFEAQFDTGLPGSPPNLDVGLELDDESVVAVESKFTEWLTPKSRKHLPFKEKYFPKDVDLWTDRSLLTCQTVARDVQSAKTRYRFLDAPQLLKHALGLATRRGTRWALVYLFLDSSGAEGDAHREEIADFTARLGSGVPFRAMSYQDLVRGFSGNLDAEAYEYVAWLSRRYLGAPSV